MTNSCRIWYLHCPLNVCLWPLMGTVPLGFTGILYFAIFSIISLNFPFYQFLRYFNFLRFFSIFTIFSIMNQNWKNRKKNTDYWSCMLAKQICNSHNCNLKQTLYLQLIRPGKVIQNTPITFLFAFFSWNLVVWNQQLKSKVGKRLQNSMVWTVLRGI